MSKFLSAKHDQPSSPQDYRAEPTYWFAVLEIARERGDFEKAAHAKSQLGRLGVNVIYQRPEVGKAVCQ